LKQIEQPRHIGGDDCLIGGFGELELDFELDEAVAVRAEVGDDVRQLGEDRRPVFRLQLCGCLGGLVAGLAPSPLNQAPARPATSSSGRASRISFFLPPEADLGGGAAASSGSEACGGFALIREFFRPIRSSEDILRGGC
jgi:hypothetical protein